MNGEFWETVWDVGNVVYDVGSILYYEFIDKDPEKAESAWFDLGTDLIAAGTPFLPAGISKLNKAGEVAKGLGKVDPNRLHHIFDKSEHALDVLVKKYGSQEKAFKAVEEAANKALSANILTPNSKGLLPTGNSGNLIKVGNLDVRLIGGKIDNGKVMISSFSRKGLK